MKQRGIMPDTPEDEPEDCGIHDPDDWDDDTDGDPRLDDFDVQDWQDAGVEW